MRAVLHMDEPYVLIWILHQDMHNSNVLSHRQRMEAVVAVRYEVKMDDQNVAQELLPLSVSMHRQNRGTIPVKE